MSDYTTPLRTRLAELADLAHAARLMQWDQQTMMPPQGGAARADALATLERISHEMFVSDDTGLLIDSAAARLDSVSRTYSCALFFSRACHA